MNNKLTLYAGPRGDIRTAVTVASAALASALILLVLFGGVAAHADATSTPVISSITASSTDTTANLKWTTDQPSNSQVAYGTTSAYGILSIFDSGLVTSHSLMLSTLTPNTLYHFQVMSANASSTKATSTDQTFTTASLSATTTATSTPTTTIPIISAILAIPTDTSVTVTWTTNRPADSQVAFGLTSLYSASSTLNSATTTSHSVMINGLASSTLYHFQVLSNNSAGHASSSDMTFTTSMSATSTGSGQATTSTTTATTTPPHGQVLRDLLDQILQKLLLIETQINALIAAEHGGGSTGSGTSTPPPVVGTAFVDQNGASVRAGTSIDFGGHNFGSEEHVNVILNGAVVGTAFTNQGGGFSTGSLSVPSTPGTYTYTLTGQNSGRTATAVVTVTSY